MKLIAGAGAPRLADAPQVPTIAETYPGFDVIAFNALIAPAGGAEAGAGETLGRHPRGDRIRRIRRRAPRITSSRKGNTPAELDAWMRQETAKWAEIAKAAKIKAD